MNGKVANEADFETAYSPGDLIVFRAADAASGTTQRIELTDKVLAGPVGKDTINTADAANPPGSSAPPPNSYGVIGQDGETVLRQVTYVTSTASANTYFLNGSAVTLARFEQELDAVKAGTKTGDGPGPDHRHGQHRGHPAPPDDHRCVAALVCAIAASSGGDRGQRLVDLDDDVAGADGLTGGDLDLLHRARLLGVDLVLHLHGLEHADGLADLDRVADGDEHLHDRALHRDGDVPVPAAPPRDAGARPAGRAAGGAAGAAAARRRLAVGTHT